MGCELKWPCAKWRETWISSSKCTWSDMRAPRTLPIALSGSLTVGGPRMIEINLEKFRSCNDSHLRLWKISMEKYMFVTRKIDTSRMRPLHGQQVSVWIYWQIGVQWSSNVHMWIQWHVLDMYWISEVSGVGWGILFYKDFALLLKERSKELLLHCKYNVSIPMSNY